MLAASSVTAALAVPKPLAAALLGSWSVSADMPTFFAPDPDFSVAIGARSFTIAAPARAFAVRSVSRTYSVRLPYRAFSVALPARAFTVTEED
jgi:hypothetical protein